VAVQVSLLEGISTSRCLALPGHCHGLRWYVLVRSPQQRVGTAPLVTCHFLIMAQAALILQELKRCKVTDVIGLPDNSSSALLELLRQDHSIRLHSVTREGEAFALAAGLWVGGKHPLVLIQNTGLLESGDGLRGTLLRMRIPILCLVTYRGYAKTQGNSGSVPEKLNAEVLSRPELDSVALMTEPTLNAWGLPFDFLHTDDHVSKIPRVLAKAEERSSPTVLLVTRDMT
jgi:sulfopyruvate decarboxylase subunit alpha